MTSRRDFIRAVSGIVGSSGVVEVGAGSCGQLSEKAESAEPKLQNVRVCLIDEDCPSFDVRGDTRIVGMPGTKSLMRVVSDGREIAAYVEPVSFSVADEDGIFSRFAVTNTENKLLFSGDFHATYDLSQINSVSVNGVAAYLK